MAKTDKERESDRRIMKLFRGRCVMNPAHPATEINEIVLRSRSKQAIDMPNNRVPLCRSCHRVYHWGGVTDEKQTIMYEKAKARLLALGENLENW
jgi:hypothetical protein